MRFGVFAILVLVGLSPGISAQSGKPSASASPSADKQTESLKRDFIDILRQADTKRFLAYVPADGVNVGPEAKHQTRDEVEQQLQHRRGLYCKLFDSSCLDAPIKLDASAKACSYREALTKSKNPRIAATATVRNGIRQAILVAQPNAKQCPSLKLIDFIFNDDGRGWKLFSVP